RGDGHDRDVEDHDAAQNVPGDLLARRTTSGHVSGSPPEGRPGASRPGAAEPGVTGPGAPGPGAAGPRASRPLGRRPRAPGPGAPGPVGGGPGRGVPRLPEDVELADQLDALVGHVAAAAGELDAPEAGAGGPGLRGAAGDGPEQRPADVEHPGARGDRVARRPPRRGRDEGRPDLV